VWLDGMESSIRLFNELRQQITEIVIIKNIKRLFDHFGKYITQAV
jgi:hypothetical protein